MATSGEVTQLLKDWNNGDRAALDKLISIIYKELRRLAAARLKSERPGHSLQATALVHEAFLRLTEWNNIRWQNRAHFLSVASQLMRNILVDHARKHGASKRGGDAYKLAFDEVDNLADTRELDLVALDDALMSLANVDPQQSRIVEMRYFGGLTFEEIAEVLGVSPATVSREWTLAKVWLLRELSKK